MSWADSRLGRTESGGKRKGWGHPPLALPQRALQIQEQCL